VARRRAISANQGHTPLSCGDLTSVYPKRSTRARTLGQVRVFLRASATVTTRPPPTLSPAVKGSKDVVGLSPGRGAGGARALEGRWGASSHFSSGPYHNAVIRSDRVAAKRKNDARPGGGLSLCARGLRFLHTCGAARPGAPRAAAPSLEVPAQLFGNALGVELACGGVELGVGCAAAARGRRRARCRAWPPSGRRAAGGAASSAGSSCRSPRS
jgi:hypothetical protein